MPPQLEQEVKLEVGPGWALPDLDGVIAGARSVALPDLHMEATYFDTADLRLARQRVTLRVRRETEARPSRAAGSVRTGKPGPGQTVEEWTVKLPSAFDGEVLARQEVTWPGGKARATKARPAGGTHATAGDVHPAAAKFVLALTLGLPLVPIAHLTTERRRARVLTSDGRHLAEVDHDIVSGRRVAPGIPETETGFDEVEVELSPGSAIEVLHAVVAKLRLAGARPSQQVSKLRAVLGDAEPKAQAKAQATAARRQPPAVLADLLRSQAARCLEQLLGHDVALRSGEDSPQHVHRSRVAVRRFNTVLRAFQRQLDRACDAPTPASAWMARLRSELSWLSHILGAARDADVRLATLTQHCVTLPADDLEGSAALVQAARRDRDDRHKQLLAAMASRRYLSLLRALEGVAHPGSPGAEAPPAQLWDRLTAPAASEASHMARGELRRMRKTVSRCGRSPTGAELHSIRHRAKRLRYLAEMACPLAGKHDRKLATKTARAATNLQDILGVLHDEAVYQAWLRQLAASGGLSPAGALTAGQLVAEARRREEAGRSAWRGPWDKLAALA